MSARRSSSGFGVNPLGWSEIAAFVRLSGVAMAPWEIEVVELIDNLFLAELARNVKGPEKPGGEA